MSEFTADQIVEGLRAEQMACEASSHLPVSSAFQDGLRIIGEKFRLASETILKLGEANSILHIELADANAALARFQQLYAREAAAKIALLEETSKLKKNIHSPDTQHIVDTILIYMGQHPFTVRCKFFDKLQSFTHVVVDDKQMKLAWPDALIHITPEQWNEAYQYAIGEQ